MVDISSQNLITFGDAQSLAFKSFFLNFVIFIQKFISITIYSNISSLVSDYKSLRSLNYIILH